MSPCVNYSYPQVEFGHKASHLYFDPSESEFECEFLFFRKNERLQEPEEVAKVLVGAAYWNVSGRSSFHTRYHFLTYLDL